MALLIISTSRYNKLRHKILAPSSILERIFSAKYLSKSDNVFYGKTQELTVALNGETLRFYSYDAL